MYSSELIKGTLKIIVLNLLKKHGRMYGYEISLKVKEITSAKIQLTEGALYPTLHALEKGGDVVAEKEYLGKRVRKYYKLTDKGSQKSTEKVNEFADFVKTMNYLLDIEPKSGYV